MTRRTVLITGGNSGLGYETAKRIAVSSSDWDVVIASRDLERSRAAVDELRKASGGAIITAMPLDLGSLAAAREFAAAFVEHQQSPLHAIVRNAWLQVVHGLSKTSDGFETTFAVNHLGHFLLVNLLLSRLSPPARIVVVSSDTHDPARTKGMPVPRVEDPHLYDVWPTGIPRSGRNARAPPVAAATPRPSSATSCSSTNSPAASRRPSLAHACRSP